MDPNLRLQLIDKVLRYITKETTYGNLRDHFEDHKEEMRSMVRKLQKDGYVELVRNDENKTLVDYNITGFNSDWWVKKTFEGDLFIDAGGYEREAIDNKNVETTKSKYDKRLLLWTAGVAIGAIGLFLWEMYKTFVIEHHSLCH